MAEWNHLTTHKYACSDTLFSYILIHAHAHTHKQASTHVHTAIDLMKIRWMLFERWVAVLLIAVCPLLLIMMGCIRENLQRIDFIWKDYLLSFSFEGWCV